MLRRRLELLFLSALLLSALPVKATEVVKYQHRGVTVIGKPAPPDATFDIDIVSAEAGANAIKDALEQLYVASNFNASAIEKLKAAGNVVIVYDPSFPSRELTKVTIAAFLPDYFQKDGNTKDFLTVVGRYGAKWSARELAPVLAHELTGHGMQRLRGRLQHVREVDLECEAYLYQENAYQELGFDKNKREMISFRQTLERHWCSDFKRWQSKNRPQSMALWDQLHPNVPKLMEDYLAYIDALLESGVATSAVKRAKQAQQEVSAAQIKKLSESNNPDEQFQLGVFLLRGIGVEADPVRAAKAFESAAEAGHGRAQYELSRMYWNGNGVAKSANISARWAKAAAEQGIAPAAYIYGAMLVNGNGVKRDIDLGVKWLEKAAEAGVSAASEALEKIAAHKKQQ